MRAVVVHLIESSHDELPLHLLHRNAGLYAGDVVVTEALFFSKELLQADFFSVDQQHGPLDQVLELPYIAPPLMGEEDGHGLL